MPAILREKLIPIYSLSESSPAGSTLFEIHKSKGVLPRRKADFLIPHRKDYYMLVLVTSGSSRHWVDGAPYTTKPDTFYFATPQQVHVKEQSQPTRNGLITGSAPPPMHPRNRH